MDTDNGTDGFKSPGRRPWLIFVFLLIAAIVLVAKLVGGGRHASQPQNPAIPPQAESATGLVVAAAVTNKPQETPAALSNAVPPATQSVAIVESLTNSRVAAAASSNAVLSTNAIALLMTEGKQLEAAGALVDAVEKYRKVIAGSADKAVVAEAEQRAGRLNIELIMSPAPMPEKQNYVAQNNDSPHKIAAKFGTTAELLQKNNRIADASKLRRGDSLRVFSGKFSIHVDKAENTLTLLVNDKFFKKYPVCTGKFDKTPDGTFKVIDKIVNPDWWRADKKVPFGDPENVLGTRWLAIEATGNTPMVKGYGIHGTKDDSSIGKAESAGCVRMKNPDVEELFTMVPYGTPVTIVGK